MQRRKFSREFKLEAVRLVKERGVAVAQAARRPLSQALPPGIAPVHLCLCAWSRISANRSTAQP